jgi:hypothetical protein
MLGVTTRIAVRERLRAVSVTLGLGAPVFFERVEEALESGTDNSMLFLDLGSCCADPTVEPIVRIWELYRPGSEVVAFTPLVDRERELRTAVGLVQGLRLAKVRVMTASDFYRDEVWQNLAVARGRATLESELRRDLLIAVTETGRPLRAEPVLLELLHEAPHHAQIRASAALPLDDVRLGANKSDQTRRARWRLLRRAGQLPASSLVLVFRLLWYLKLREAGWSTARISQFLGFPSARHFRSTVQRRFGVGLRALRGVRYADGLRWAAELITSDYASLGRLPVKALAGMLLRQAGGPERERTAPHPSNEDPQ